MIWSLSPGVAGAFREWEKVLSFGTEFDYKGKNTHDIAPLINWKNVESFVEPGGLTGAGSLKNKHWPCTPNLFILRFELLFIECTEVHGMRFNWLLLWIYSLLNFLT